MAKKYLLVLLAVTAAGWAAKEAPSFSPDAYVSHVKFLASPELEGRGAGTAGLEKAARYIEGQFKSYGLKPIPGKSFLQEFNVTVAAHLGPKTALNSLQVEKDFVPFNFSSVGAGDGPVVFAGYGITAKEYNYDDYAGLDVKGKFVLILRHEPQEMDEKSVFAGKNFTSHAQYVSKASNAKAHGARGVILVNDTPTHPSDPDRFERFGSVEGPGDAGVLYVQISAAEADRWLAPAGKNLKDIVAGIDKDLKPQSFVLDKTTVHLSVDIRKEVKPVHNIVAYLPGETDEYVVVGAHYDHLGMGGSHSLAPNEVKIHPGADDNASGSAGLLEVARYFASQPKHRRGILFLSFAGEELGLLGSQFYVDHPELPLDHAVAMINMDMIGRMKDSKVFLSGVGTGSTLQAMVNETAPKRGINLDISEKAGYGSSDHTSFTSKQVPVLFFFSGLHADYHKPSDTWDKIDGAAAAKLLGLVADLTNRLADDEVRPKYVRVSDPPVTGVGRRWRLRGVFR